MITDPLFYVAAIPAMVLLGLAKGGFGPIGILVVPIIALVISPVQAAGIVLPILILSDVIGLVAYRGAFDARTLKVFVPGGLIGIGIAWLAASWVSEDAVRLIVGTIAIAFAANYLFAGGHARPAAPHSTPRGLFWGTLSGITSFFAHAGAPPFQVYVGALRLEPRCFAATAVYTFAILNAVKLVPFFALGQFDSTNLTTSAVLLPVSAPATLLGIWLVKRTTPTRFYPIIYGMMIVVGVYLVGVAAWSFLSGAA